MYRLKPDPAIILITLFQFGCQSYRLQYNESFYLNEQILKSSSIEPTDPEADREKLAETEYGPFTYLYEESFETPGWFAWACGFTAFYYGGACWTYKFFPFGQERVEFIQRAQEKLSMLTGEYKTYGSQFWVINRGNIRTEFPPRLRVMDDEGESIIRGRVSDFTEPKAKLFFDSEIVIDDAGHDSYQSGEEPVLGNLSRYQQNYSYSAAQVGFLSGLAQVRSKVKENGRDFTIAAGEVETQQYHFRLRMLPKDGFYWSFAPQYSYQSVKIKDFVSDLPLAESSTEEDIPVIISDPQTQTIIENFTNAYNVSLQSLGVLIGGGYSFHYKRENQNNFWSHDGGAWLNGISMIQSEVRFQGRKVRNKYLGFLTGASIELNSYYNWTQKKISLGFHYHYGVFPRINMPDDMEFRGNPRFNSEKNIFERPRLFVDELEFSSSIIGISLSYIYKEFEF